MLSAGIEVRGRMTEAVEHVHTGSMHEALVKFIGGQECGDGPRRPAAVLCPQPRYLPIESLQLMTDDCFCLGFYGGAADLAEQLLSWLQQRHSPFSSLFIVCRDMSLTAAQVHFFKAVFLLLQRDLSVDVHLYHPCRTDF